MIEGVEIKKLKINVDERGFLMEILRSDDKIFKHFGQVYMTMCKKGIAKAWHYHKNQDDYFVCVSGKALVVLCDKRKGKTFNEVNEFILEAPPSNDAILLKIPAGVVHGFTALTDEARIVNIPTELYNYLKPDEFRIPWNSSEIPYKWPDFVKNGG
jgi:dTDP-4-dehydrorhamnose 3,5-epimerase